MNSFNSDIRNLINNIYAEQHCLYGTTLELINYLERYLGQNVTLEVITPIDTNPVVTYYPTIESAYVNDAVSQIMITEFLDDDAIFGDFE